MKKPIIMDDQDAYKADAAKVNVEILAALEGMIAYADRNRHRKDGKEHRAAVAVLNKAKGNQ